MDVVAYVLAKKYTDATTAALAGGMHYRGAVATKQNLPSSAQPGDIYTVEANGLEYAWGLKGGTNQWIEIGKDYDEELAKKANNKTLMFEETRTEGGITYGNLKLDGVVQTYSQIEAMLEDINNDVVVFWRDGKVILMPSTGDGTGMIQFANVYEYNDEAWLMKIAINSQNVCKYEGIQLATNDAVFNAQTTADSAAQDAVDAMGAANDALIAAGYAQDAANEAIALANDINTNGAKIKVTQGSASTAVGAVALTQAQYDGLATKDPNTLYLIIEG